MADERIILQLDTADSAVKARELGLELEHVQVAAAGIGHTAGSSGDFGRGMLQASYAVQDFTSVLGTQGLGRALAAVQNNIPGLLMALGPGAGVAGAVSVITVGAGLLYENWDKIARLWGQGQTEEEAKRMRELAKATEQAVEAGKRLAATLPPEQRQTQGNLKRAVDAFGGEAVLKELQAALVAKSGSFGAEADRAMAQTLFNRLNRGDRSAEALLGDLDLRGGVGQVLRGGKTPAEERRERNAVLDKQARERREAAEGRRRDRAAKAREVAGLEEEYAAGSEAIGQAERQERESARAARVREDVNLGRRIGREAARPDRGPKLDLRHIDATPMHAGPMDARMAAQIAENQQALAANQAADLAALRRLEAVGREARRQNRMRRQPLANDGWN